MLKLRRGEITKEEYIRERNANFADVLDDEDEINGKLNRIRRKKQEQQTEDQKQHSLLAKSQSSTSNRL